jgi:hypothetical protein
VSVRRGKTLVNRLVGYGAFVDRLLADGRLDAAVAELQHMGGAIMGLPVGRVFRQACAEWLARVVRLAEARNARRAWVARCATANGRRIGPLRVIS